MNGPIPYHALDAVFLDAGNTLVYMDFEFLCRGFAAVGVTCEPGNLARVEAASRQAISDHIATGQSTETRDTRRFWIGEVLGRMPGSHDPATLTQVVDTMLDWLDDHDVQRQVWTHVPADVPQALADLRAAGFRLVVVSNSNGTIERGLRDLGLGPLFDGILDSAVIGIEKPRPGIFEHALELAGTTPERSLHVGDLYGVDVVGARAAGIHGVLVDPYDDHPGLDCDRFPSVAALATRLLENRAPGS